MTKKVMLLVGGWSAERQISLDTGKEIEKALQDAGYDVTVVDVKKDLNDFVSQLTPKPDVVFNNLYGLGGENGIIQSVLEMMEIPYTHSGVMTSSLAMNKPMTKRIAMTLGIQSPEGVVAHKEDIMLSQALDPPYVLKPISGRSGVGVRVIKENDTVLFDENWTFGEYVLLERFIEGRELTCAVLNGDAQDVTELVSNVESQIKNKEYLLPASIPTDVKELIKDWSERLYIALGCNGLVTCDYIYDDRIDEASYAVYFLEINMQPTLTSVAVGPSQVIHNGMSFIDLCRHLVETAKCHETAETKKVQDDQILERDQVGVADAAA